MFTNYIKIAWRNIVKNKLYSIINIGGLAIGMAISFMLFLYVYNEYSFDGFQQKKDRLYRVYANQQANGNIYTIKQTPLPLAGALKKDLPQIENIARASNASPVLFDYNNNGSKINLMKADPAILDMFTFDFVEGDSHKAFNEVASVILTTSAAKKIFGNKDPMGQTIKIYDKYLAKVTGVIKDLPLNSSLRPEAMISWAFVKSMNPSFKTDEWDNYSFATYVLLKPGVNTTTLNAEVKNLIGRYNPEDKNIQLFLFPYVKQHLQGDFKNGVNIGGSIEYVRLFLFLAIGILLIACINFMNLSTARSEKRAREVGVRKVVGASRFIIISQFLGESLLMAFIALVIAFILMIALLPFFNTLIDQNLAVPYNNTWMWAWGILITLVTGLVAGSYPALFLSSFKPVKVLKGLSNAGKATLRPRQVLVIIQFSFATCLILCSILIYQQITFIKNKPVGYNRYGLVELPVDGVLNQKFENFRQDAINSGAITDGALTSETITNNSSNTTGVVWPGQVTGEEKTPIDQIVCTYHFTSTYGVKLDQGRDFSIDRPADSLSLLLNESAVKMMKLKNPIGQQVKWQGINRTVVGVVKDFVWGSPYEPVKPVIIGFAKDWAGRIGLRLNPNKSVSQSLAILQQVFKQYNPDYPMDYSFVDEGFNSKFKTEKLLGTLSAGFTVLAILISCLGLFGLASFSAEQRRKEIGIRKVLGASISNLWLNLSMEFLLLVTISFFIGASVSWYYMYGWLSQYTYRISVNIWVFVLTISLSIVVCLLTVSYQAIKAALANPVRSLRSE